MEHMAWKGRIKPGCKAEYQKRRSFGTGTTSMLVME